MVLLLLPTVALAATPAQLDAALLACALQPVHALPALSVDRKRSLLAGEVVRILQRSKEDGAPSAAVGIAVLKASRDALWIAAQDPHIVVDDSLTEQRVENLGPDRNIWYGYYDLPRPFRDRQWVVDSRNNHTLAQVSEGACWEHPWSLVPDGLSRMRRWVSEHPDGSITDAHLDHALFAPVAHGSWFMAPVAPGEVLVAYQAWSVVGGSVPDWVVLQIAMSRVEKLLVSVQTRAQEWSPAHYTTAHAPVHGGDGAPIAPLSGPELPTQP